MIEVGIVGGTGYTGAELLRLLARHPQARVTVLTSRQEAGQRVDALFPALRGICDLRFSAPEVETLAACQAVFFATPHGIAMEMAPALVARGVKVIDLSADFRLKDPDVYQRWYQRPHACPELLGEAVYGIPELRRHEIARARLVGNPGCYPTAVLLGLAPLIEAGAADGTTLIADCKSGVSGAGRELKPGSMYGEVAESFKAYATAGHRHQAELEQELALLGARGEIVFVPHLVPMFRGMQATIYARLVHREVDLQALYESRYRAEPFVDVLPAGSEPDTRSVRGANVCRIAVHRPRAGATAVVLAVIDNLVKGACGQAIQCFNLMFGLSEHAGLDVPPLAP
jgi:N-acetyl-gamma-glutamyl-phosphate reductase